MRRCLMVVLMAGLWAGVSAEAHAEDPAPATGCVKVIPARCECVEHEVPVPAVTRIETEPVYEDHEEPIYKMVHEAIWEDVEVPIWKSRRVPVMATRRIPIYEDVEVPCFKVRRIPIYVTHRIPVFEDIEVPVFAAERIPVTKEVCDPCTGEMVTVVCGHDVQVVQCGTRTERRIKGFEEKQVQCGWRPERFQDGTRTVRKVVDWKEEQYECSFRYERYQDGTRTERRCVGHDVKRVQTGTRTIKICTGVREKVVEVCPARMTTRTERVTIPCRRVTVVPDGATKGAPLPGTDEVLTESEYAAARR